MSWEETGPWIYAVLLALSWLGGSFLTLLGFAGNWMMAAVALGYQFLVPQEHVLHLGWGWVTAMLVLAGVGELLESFSGLAGAKHAGASRRGMILSMLGSMIGAMFGFSLGNVVIPVLGGIVGVFLVAGLGALVGALLGEIWKGKGMKASTTIGTKAMIGRMMGSLAKSMISVAIVLCGCLGLVF